MFLLRVVLFPDTRSFLVIMSNYLMRHIHNSVVMLQKQTFIEQNTFTDLKCNIHSVLPQPPNIWVTFVFQSVNLLFEGYDDFGQLTRCFLRAPKVFPVEWCPLPWNKVVSGGLI